MSSLLIISPKALNCNFLDSKIQFASNQKLHLSIVLTSSVRGAFRDNESKKSLPIIRIFTPFFPPWLYHRWLKYHKYMVLLLNVHLCVKVLSCYYGYNCDSVTADFIALPMSWTYNRRSMSRQCLDRMSSRRILFNSNLATYLRA